jgi:hypothetical protein
VPAGRSRAVNCEEGSMSKGPEPGAGGAIEDLERLLSNLEAIDPDALREEEFAMTQSMLDTLKGKTIKRATMEPKRIVLETTEGNRYFFYGFIGESDAPT